MGFTLLEETLEQLKAAGKSTDDVKWVGSRDGKFVAPWKVAEPMFNVDYDSGFGAQEVAPDLVVVGQDWWLERHEYDGSEWWEYKTMPRMREAEPLPRVFNRYGGVGGTDE